MLESVFSCPWCSRVFLNPPFVGPIPPHLDALLGLPCEGGGRNPPSIQDLPGFEDEPLEWPPSPRRAA